MAQIRVTQGKQPQGVANGDRIYITYGHDDAIWCIASADGGKRFDAPVCVIRAPKIPLGMRRGPRIAAIDDGIVITSAIDGDVRAFRSKDQGRTFSEGLKITDSPNAAREGFGAVASDRHQKLFCVWPDMRNGKMEIWGASSTDGGKTFSANIRIYKSPAGAICPCCHPSVTFGPDGKIYVMFRNDIDDHRDMYLARTDDGGKTFSPAQKLGNGTWKFNACPMDGGSIAVTDRVLTVWRRESDIFVSDPNEPETRLGAGMQPVISPDTAQIAWITRRGGDLLVRENGSNRKIASAAGDPAFAGSMLLWESAGAIWCSRLDSPASRDKDTRLDIKQP